MNKIVTVISGGLMGQDPYDPTSWSGSSLALIKAFESLGICERAYGADISKAERLFRIACSFSFDSEVWRRKLYTGKGYRESLTRHYQAKTQAEDDKQFILQLGAYINSRELYGKNATIASYQDGNLYEYVNSPFVNPKLLQHKTLIEDAIAYEVEVAKSMDLVFTTSEYLRQSFIEHYGIEPNKVLNVNAGINIPQTENDKSKTKDYTSQDILFIGKSEFERKGGDLAVAAVNQLAAKYPDIHLHLVGPETTLEQRYGSDYVSFHGFLDKADQQDRALLDSLFEKCALIVMPSRYEPLGLAPLEAMVRGIPAIVTGEWALKDNVISGEHGLHCNYGDAIDLADKIDQLLAEPKRIETMAQNGPAYVKQKFCWENTAKEIFRHFNELRT